MENKLNQLTSDLFSQLLISKDVPDHSKIKTLKKEIVSGIGPFASDGEYYSFDLRHVHEKGALSYSHPIYYKSLIDSIVNTSSIYKKNNIDILQYSFIKDLPFNDECIKLVTEVADDVEIFNIDNYFNNKSIDYHSVIVRNLLFTDSKQLFDLEILKRIKAKIIYFDLGVGAFIKVGKSNRQENIPAFYENLIPRYFKFIQNVLLNDGKGRISSVEKILKERGFKAQGCYFQIKKNKLIEKPILFSEGKDYIYLNIPTSISDQLLQKCLEFIYE